MSPLRGVPEFWGPTWGPPGTHRGEAEGAGWLLEPGVAREGGGRCLGTPRAGEAQGWGCPRWVTGDSPHPVP